MKTQERNMRNALLLVMLGVGLWLGFVMFLVEVLV